MRKKVSSKVEDSKEDGNDRNEQQIDSAGQVIIDGDQILGEEEHDMAASDSGDNNDIQDDSDYEYKLVGVVCHMGTAGAGHYLSYINVDRDKEAATADIGSQTKSREEWLYPKNTRWLELNDSTVQSFDNRNLD